MTEEQLQDIKLLAEEFYAQRKIVVPEGHASVEELVPLPSGEGWEVAPSIYVTGGDRNLAEALMLLLNLCPDIEIKWLLEEIAFLNGGDDSEPDENPEPQQ